MQGSFARDTWQLRFTYRVRLAEAIGRFQSQFQRIVRIHFPEQIVYLKLDGGGPRYAQLVRALKAAILDGRIGTGARLPSTRALAVELGVSRNTVMIAYDQLGAEGFVEGPLCKRILQPPSGCRTWAVRP